MNDSADATAARCPSTACSRPCCASAGWRIAWRQRRTLDAWDAVVGREIAAHARAVDLENGVLTLQADHGAWRQELTLLMPQIMERFNSRFGPGTVTEIQWARPATDRRTRDNRD